MNNVMDHNYVYHHMFGQQDLSIDCFGHASVRIEAADGKVVYVDPWAEVLPDTYSDDANIVFSTHSDHDHFDPEAIKQVSKSDTRVVLFDGIDYRNDEYDIRTISIDEEILVDGVTVEAIPAYNKPGGNHLDIGGDPFHVQGDTVGLLLEINDNTVFYPSDSDYVDEHQDIETDILIPPAGGLYTMNMYEVIRLAKEIDPEVVFPIHYDTWEDIRIDSEMLREELESIGCKVKLLQ